MAIAFVNAAAVVASASGTAVTTALPTGWAAGDILILSLDNNT